MEEPSLSDVMTLEFFHSPPPLTFFVAQAKVLSALSLAIKTSSPPAEVRVVSPKLAVPSNFPVTMDEPSLSDVMP